MAASDTDLDEDAATGGNGKRGKLIMIVLVALVAIIGGGAFVYFSGMLTPKDDAALPEPVAETEVKKSAPKSESSASSGPAAFYELPPQVVNLGGDDRGRSSFIKVVVVLELANESDVKALEPMNPRIVDIMLTYLRGLRATDLAGSAGMQRLREELLTRINKAVYPVEVQDVLFKEMLVQ